MVLFISLIFDLALLVSLMVKNKSISKAVRFIAFSAVINFLAYYINCGLTKTFSENILLDIICAVTARIFIVYSFHSAKQGNNMQKLHIYLFAIAISMCIHNVPLYGVICEMIVLVFLLYAEYSSHKERNPAIPTETDEHSQYLRTVEENYRKSRELWHDLNNHILCMRSFAENGRYDELLDYINDLSDNVADNMLPVKSGNIVLDALLADKYHKAKKAGVFVIFESVRYTIPLDDGDLCISVGNLFDNAIEENLRSANKDGRFINVHISSCDDTLMIKFKNPLCHQITVKGGLPATIKPDVIHHGMGLKNVRRICDRYNGELIWTVEKNVFAITVRLKQPSNPSNLTSTENSTKNML